MIVWARIADSSLSIDEHIDAVRGPRHGAIATFIGTVRDHDPSVDGEVASLDYSAHPDAPTIIERIAERVCPNDVTLAVTHRVGLLSVGDVAIVAAAASAHRAQAFDACRTVVEAVKAELPVWKREILIDGSHTWVGIS